MPVGQTPRRLILPAVIAAMAMSALGQEPTTAPAGHAPEEIVVHMREDIRQVHVLFPGVADLSDPAKRATSGEAGKTLLKDVLADIDALAAAQPNVASKAPEARAMYEALLACLGDADMQAALDRRAAGADATDALRAQRVRLLGRWYAGGADAARQSAVIDDFEKLAKANVADGPLTALAVQMKQTGAMPDAAKRLDELATTVMQNPLATQYKAQLAEEAKLKTIEGKPLAIAGKLPDGREFTTADWKGKVVLVDFWAVWCGPCKAILPRVKKAYTDFHAKGLEVVGVSNDYDAASLNKYVTDQAMPWPQLFDAEAAADHTWNSITTGFSIHAIPTMFLIDKAGVCRTVDAREDFEQQIAKLLSEPVG